MFADAALIVLLMSKNKLYLHTGNYLKTDHLIDILDTYSLNKVNQYRD